MYLILYVEPYFVKIDKGSNLRLDSDAPRSGASAARSSGWEAPLEHIGYVVTYVAKH